MLWPVEWVDIHEKDYAGYLDRRAFFSTMRAFEAAGLQSGFPHPADQYEVLTSKAWMATLALDPRVKLPAATLVSKGRVLADAYMAAKQALGALARIRAVNPFQADTGGASDAVSGPSTVNRKAIKKGVVKLGWSWEARYVTIFEGEEQLAERLREMLTHPGCFASSCLVQEWVDFDFEMRLYFLPPVDWADQERFQPTRIEMNAWGGSLSDDERRSFHRLSKTDALKLWKDDRVALRAAREEAIETSQHLLSWLRCVDAQSVPMIRLDFMLKYRGPGKAQVVFGEFCEMGACCLGWVDGPPTIWRAALDHALH